MYKLSGSNFNKTTAKLSFGASVLQGWWERHLFQSWTMLTILWNNWPAFSPWSCFLQLSLLFQVSCVSWCFPWTWPHAFSLFKGGFGLITCPHHWILPSYLFCISLVFLASRLSLTTDDDSAQEGNQTYWKSLEILSSNTIMNSFALVEI